MNNTITAQELLEVAANEETVRDYYKSLLIGNGGQTYCRLYFDLRDNTLFEHCEASCNTWLHRDDGSLVEIHAHNCYGADLTDEEREWLEQDGVNDFGYSDWLLDVIIDTIDEALDSWRNIDKAGNRA